jgi:hypothetical protein
LSPKKDDSPDLAPWKEVREYADWKGLLVGNGASVAIYPPFRYGSLYEIAASGQLSHPLSEDDQALFGIFATENFEQVLAGLKTAGLVTEALDLDPDDVLEERYDSIQRALFEAVHAVHVPWLAVAEEHVSRLFKILRRYRFVYSTNYDLLLYWASMDDGGTGFLDYFWGDGGTFDVFDTDIWATKELWTRLLFIHGGIHLRRLRGGGTRQLHSSDGSLLDQFLSGWTDEESPLLVSEGESADKMASISSSDYLTFAHSSFAEHEGGLVVFGHTLGEQDEHLVRPMRSWQDNPVAISIRPSDDEEKIIQQKDHIRSRLSPMKNIVFYDASTHPLGRLPQVEA